MAEFLGLPAVAGLGSRTGSRHRAPARCRASPQLQNTSTSVKNPSKTSKKTLKTIENPLKTHETHPSRAPRASTEASVSSSRCIAVSKRSPSPTASG